MTKTNDHTNTKGAQPVENTTGQHSITRRRLLAGAGALGLSGLLAACGGDDAASPGTSGTRGVPGSTGPGASTAPGATPAASVAPRAGGTLRFGYTQGTVNDSLDLPTAVNDYMIAIGRQMNAGLGRVTLSGEFEGRLAEELINESPTEVVVRLKDGVEFHNGKTITADDVLASYRMLADPNGLASARPFLVDLDLAASEVVDERTVRFVLTKPNAFIVNGLAHQHSVVYPDGKFDPANPVGAGPWKLKNHTPGTSTEFERFANYPTPALLDGLIIQNFADMTAASNALAGGTIDALGKLPANLIDTFGSQIKVLRSDTGGWGAFVLDASKAPFDDPRVREAFKLIVDRQGMVDQLQSGLGTVANDLFSPTDSVYIGGEVEQRVQDIDRGKALLAEAGVKGLTLDIAVGGLTPNAEVVLAEQLRAAGVTLNVNQVDSTTYFSSHYGQDPIYSTLWPTLTYAAQVASSLGPGAFYPEGNWVNEEFQALWADAQTDLDASTRADKLKQMQRLFYADGTYLIPFFQVEIDAMASNVQGGEPDASGWPFRGFNFTEVYFA